MPKRWKYIIAYDSPSNNRRSCMLNRIQGFGFDPQLSFHECALSVGERRELWDELINCIDVAQDKLVLLRLDPRNEQWRLGKPNTPNMPPPIIYIG